MGWVAAVPILGLAVAYAALLFRGPFDPLGGAAPTATGKGRRPVSLTADCKSKLSRLPGVPLDGFIRGNKGVAVMTATKGGLMYEASVGGQKFSFERIKEQA